MSSAATAASTAAASTAGSGGGEGAEEAAKDSADIAAFFRSGERGGGGRGAALSGALWRPGGGRVGPRVSRALRGAGCYPEAVPPVTGAALGGGLRTAAGPLREPGPRPGQPWLPRGVKKTRGRGGGRTTRGRRAAGLRAPGEREVTRL